LMRGSQVARIWREVGCAVSANNRPLPSHLSHSAAQSWWSRSVTVQGGTISLAR
jgi:hypothetical protein